MPSSSKSRAHQVNWATGQVYRIEKWYAVRLSFGAGESYNGELV
jgi:hypothetical protein